jgi:uncharacterized protein YuzE
MKNIEVKMSFDETSDSGYLYLKNISSGDVAATESFIIETNGCTVNVDLDNNHRIIGFEFIGMKDNFTKEIMSELEGK